MKKILLWVILFLVALPYVNAAENELVFKEVDQKLYYVSKNGDIYFMNHPKMYKTSKYEDKMILNNDSDYQFDLYFQIKLRNQEDYQDDFLEYINMEIYLDNKLIYNGNAKGMDVSMLGVDLTNAIVLGSFSPKQVRNLLVKTSMNSSYQLEREEFLSYVDWAFYTDYKSTGVMAEVKEIEVPKTSDPLVRYIIIGVVFLLFIICLIIYLRKEKKK